MEHTQTEVNITIENWSLIDKKKTFNVLYFQYEIYIPWRCNKIWKYNLNGRKINFINNIYRHQYNVML